MVNEASADIPDWETYEQSTLNEISLTCLPPIKVLSFVEEIFWQSEQATLQLRLYIVRLWCGWLPNSPPLHHRVGQLFINQLHMEKYERGFSMIESKSNLKSFFTAVDSGSKALEFLGIHDEQGTSPSGSSESQVLKA